jgi:fructosamine-3-kinase
VHSRFVKRYDPADPGSPRLEAAGLAWLAQATVSGGVQTPAVFAIRERELVIERIAPAPANRQAGEAFGAGLAQTHAAGAAHFGSPPPGWSEDGSIGLAPLPLTRADDAPGTWGAFWARYRIEPYVRAGIGRGHLPPDSAGTFARLAERLVAGDFDSPQPGQTPAVARLHGDLWSGNVLWTDPGRRPGWTGAVIIDPAAHGGHAETDLAMLALFGTPQLDTIRAAYHEVSPLAPGWRERLPLHQLHPLLVHAVLFGGSYGRRAVDTARHYVGR